MEMKTLQSFLVIAEEENITKAAGLLHLSQPTLSRQLKLLEDELGVSLFTRQHHRIQLTGAGMLFRQRAQDIVNLMAKTKIDLKRHQDIVGEVSIGCSELRSMTELATIMEAFCRKHPMVKFALHSGNNHDIKVWLDQGTIDVGLLLKPVDTGQYDFVELHQEEEWGVLVDEQSPFNRYSCIRPGDLVGTQVITILDTVVQKTLADWSGPYARQMANWARYNLTYNAAMLAQQTKGVVICLKLNQHFDHLRFIPLEPRLSLHSILAWRGQGLQSKATAAFVKMIQQRYSV